MERNKRIEKRSSSKQSPSKLHVGPAAHKSNLSLRQPGIQRETLCQKAKANKQTKTFRGVLFPLSIEPFYIPVLRMQIKMLFNRDYSKTAEPNDSKFAHLSNINQ